VSRAEWGGVVVRTAVAWAILTVAGLFWGRGLVELLAPLLSIVADAIDSAYLPILDVRDMTDGLQLFMTAHVLHPLWVHDGLTLNPGATMTAGVSVLHILVPLVIQFTALWAWPASGWRERLLFVASGLPMALLVLSLTIPFLLAGKIDMLLIDYAAQGGEIRNHTLLLNWMIFGESGAIWLIPLIAATLCVTAVRSAERNREA